MPLDRLAHLPRLRRPAAAIGAIAALHLVGTLPLAVAALDQSWRRPVMGLTMWMVWWLLSAVPLTALATLVAGRFEEAATGIRHPMRLAWLGVALGVLLGAHWFWVLVWTPTFLFQAATTGYRFEDNLMGAVVSGLAWVFFGAGTAIATVVHRRMHGRPWEGLERDQKPASRWIPTSVLGAGAWLWALGPLSSAIGALAVEERDVVAALLVWSVVGVVLGGVGARWGAWVHRGLDHGRSEGSPGAWELFGLAWIAHWTPAWLWAVAPVHSASRHEEQLVTSLAIAVLLLGGTAAWSYGRSARRARAESVE